MIDNLDKHREVLLDALIAWGHTSQVVKAMEELAELIQALGKSFFHGDKNTDSIAEEIADVLIMVEQMAIAFNVCGIVDKKIEEKIDRLAKMLAETPQMKYKG